MVIFFLLPSSNAIWLATMTKRKQNYHLDFPLENKACVNLPICPNPLCCKKFKSFVNLVQHVSHPKSTCGQFRHKLLEHASEKPLKKRFKSDTTNNTNEENGKETDSMSNNSNGSLAWDDESIDAGSFGILGDANTNNLEEMPNSHPAENEEHQVEIKTLDARNNSFTKEQCCEVQLLKMLNDANAPHFLCTDMMKWARDSRLRNYNFMPK